MTDKLTDIFDSDPLETGEPTTPEPTDLVVRPASAIMVPVDPDAEEVLVDLNADVEKARSTISDSIALVNEAFKSAILLAQSGDEARPYEVVATMLTAIVNANKELVALHQSKEDTTSTHRARVSGSSSGRGKGVTIEKAVFVGRASDLLRELKAAKTAIED